MQIAGRVCVVTGGANGIGRALANEFARRGAAGVVVADIDVEHATAVAERIGGLAVECDVARPGALDALVERARDTYGRVDIFCSNAGVADPPTGGLAIPLEAFERVIQINMVAHLAAAKAVVPEMVERGSGYLLQTLSSAALIGGPAPAGYTMSKFGALGLAEWLRLYYGDRGVRVSCLCPNAVYTGMQGRPSDLDSPAELPEGAAAMEMLLPEDVATQTADAMEGPEPFLILPHPRVGASFTRKAANYDDWLARSSARLTRMRPAVS
jgi:NAD(P)-dependent dehydrogenase (short-subunit alcohol dehydrogenase family)